MEMEFRQAWEILVQQILDRRRRGYKIVFTNGCFDIFHAGHVGLLKFCEDVYRLRTSGLVVVGVNSDESIRRLKGNSRPINKFKDRITVLQSCRYVWQTVGFDEDTPDCLIREIKPDTIVKGSEYKNKYVAGAEFIATYGGQVELYDMLPDVSTSLITERIKDGC